jgi:hypothetical protein
MYILRGDWRATCRVLAVVRACLRCLESAREVAEAAARDPLPLCDRDPVSVAACRDPLRKVVADLKTAQEALDDALRAGRVIDNWRRSKNWLFSSIAARKNPYQGIEGFVRAVLSCAEGDPKTVFAAGPAAWVHLAIAATKLRVPATPDEYGSVRATWCTAVRRQLKKLRE